MAKRKGNRFAVRPRTIVIIIIAILLLAGAGVWYSLRVLQHPGRVQLRDWSAESTGTVGFAGFFPAEGDDALVNPLGIASDGELLYIAESDAARISILDLSGGRVGVIGLSAKEGVSSVYPSSVAVVEGDRLAIVDNAGARVIVVAADEAESARILLTLGQGADAPGQPTSVTYGAGEYFVFDAAVAGVRVYDEAGKFVRTIGTDLKPQVSFGSDLALVGKTLYVVDANAGRVLELHSETGEQLLIFEDRFTLPRVIAPIDANTVAVIDTFDRAGYITSASGKRLDVIDAITVPEGALSSPRGAVWIGEDLRLYVADAALGRIMVFNVRLDRP